MLNQRILLSQHIMLSQRMLQAFGGMSQDILRLYTRSTLQGLGYIGLPHVLSQRILQALQALHPQMVQPHRFCPPFVSMEV